MNDPGALADLVATGDHGAIPLARRLGEAAWPALQPLAASEDPDVRELTFLCLATIASAAHTPVLLAALSDPSVPVRHVALRGLKRAATRDLAPALVAAAHTQSEAAVREGLLALTLSLPGGDAGALPAAISDPNAAAEQEASPVARTLWLLLAARTEAPLPPPDESSAARSPGVPAPGVSDAAGARQAFCAALLDLAPTDLARLLTTTSLATDQFARPPLTRLLTDEEAALWIHSDLRPDTPAYRRVCDLAADQLIAALTAAGSPAPPREIACSPEARDALRAAVAGLHEAPKGSAARP